MEKLVKGNFPEVKDDNNQESLNYLEQYFDNVTVDKTVHKAPGSISLLYEQMIGNFQSETLFLREQLKFKDIYFNGKILHLKSQLNDCLHRLQIKRDNSGFLSCVDKLNLL